MVIHRHTSRHNKLNRKVLNDLVESNIGWVSLSELMEIMCKVNPRSGPTNGLQVGALTHGLKKERRKYGVHWVYVGRI